MKKYLVISEKRLMKKYLMLGITCSVVAFTAGIYWERSASWHDQEEWMQIAQEACDMRLKTLKFTCKK